MKKIGSLTKVYLPHDSLKIKEIRDNQDCGNYILLKNVRHVFDLKRNLIFIGM